MCKDAAHAESPLGRERDNTGDDMTVALGIWGLSLWLLKAASFKWAAMYFGTRCHTCVHGFHSSNNHYKVI